MMLGYEHLRVHRSVVHNIKKKMSLKGVSVRTSKTNSIYSVKLGHGIWIAMVSDPASKIEDNFQRKYSHCVPPRKGVKGSRINITFRSNKPSESRTLAQVLASAEYSKKLSDMCYLCLWNAELTSKTDVTLIH